MKLVKMINVITIVIVLIVVSVIAARMGDVVRYSAKNYMLLTKIEKHASQIALFAEMYPEWIVSASDPKIGLRPPSSLPSALWEKGGRPKTKTADK